MLQPDSDSGLWSALQDLLAPENPWRNVAMVVLEVMAMRKLWKMGDILEYLQSPVLRLLQDSCWTLKLQALNLFVAIIHDNF
jgi:hypothetical protein